MYKVNCSIENNTISDNTPLPSLKLCKQGKDIVCALRNKGIKRREDRVERTAGVSIVLPRALSSSYRAAKRSAESILSAKLTSRLDFPMTSLIDYQVDRRKVEVWQHT